MVYGLYGEKYDYDKLKQALTNISSEDLYGVVRYYCQEAGYEFPFDDFYLEDYIEHLKPYDAFMLGKGMEGSLNGELYIFNGYGNIESTTEAEFADIYRDDPNFIEFIIENNLIDDTGLDSEDFIIEDEEEE